MLNAKNFESFDGNALTGTQFGSLAQMMDESRPKSPIQWICRESVGKLGFNELDNKYSVFRSPENEIRLV